MSDETAIYLRVKGNIVCVNGRSAVVGRSRTCDVQIDEQGISRRHCEVLLRDDGAAVRDLGSSHGTWIAGRRITGEERLHAGIVVTLGQPGHKFELVNAIARGSAVLGAAPTERPRTAAAAAGPAPGAASERGTISAPSPAATAAATPGGSRFFAGLVWGFLVGLAAGAAVAALVEDLPL